MKEKIIKIIKYILISILPLAAATGLGSLVWIAGFQDTNIVLLYILAVLVTARLSQGYMTGILVSVLGTLAFNYFFTDPYFTLNVNNPNYPVTFVIMTLAAIVTSTLTSRVKYSEQKAKEQERETKALFEFTSKLTQAEDMKQITKSTAEAASSWFQCKAICVYIAEDEHAEPTSLGPYVEEYVDFTISSAEQILGAVRIPKDKASTFGEEERSFLYSMVECTALAMGRERSMQQQMQSQQAVAQERYRGNLLRAISHDLRTPLSGIMDTSQEIVDMSEKEDRRYGLAMEINKDSHWLHALVENILSLTKIHEGGIKLVRRMEPFKEVVEESIHKITARAPEYSVKVNMPKEEILVPMEGNLVMQVLINLLDNAVKHCIPQQEIAVSVEKDTEQDMLVVTVSNEGEGINEEDLPNLFQLFYTSKSHASDVKKGIGLGLSICDSIVRVHGGSITGRNKTHGPGAEFIFTLPLHAPGEIEE